MEESRKRFEEWYASSWRLRECEIRRELAIDDNGDYIYSGAYNSWCAWQASRAAIEKGSIVAYQDPYGNAVSAGDFDGGEDEMHETAYQEEWTPLVRAAGIKVKNG